MVKTKRDAKRDYLLLVYTEGKNTRFEVILESEEEGDNSVNCSDLKGCLLVLNEKTAPNLRSSLFNLTSLVTISCSN